MKDEEINVNDFFHPSSFKKGWPRGPPPVPERKNYSQCPCDSLPISVNNGRYIAITTEPIVTPRNPISNGSINVNRLAIAESTSAS